MWTVRGERCLSSQQQRGVDRQRLVVLKGQLGVTQLVWECELGTERSWAPRGAGDPEVLSWFSFLHFILLHTTGLIGGLSRLGVCQALVLLGSPAV